MRQELKLGKYEFYPYRFDEVFMDTPSLEKLLEMLKSTAKAKVGENVETPSRLISESRPRRKRHG